MNKLRLFFMAVVVVALSVSTSQADLLSLYTFDTNANNSVGGAPNGTLVGTAAIVGGGAVGGAVDIPGPSGNHVSLTAGAYPQPDAFATDLGGFWTGTMSLWVNSTDMSGNWNSVINRGGGTNIGMTGFPGFEWYADFAAGADGNLFVTPTNPPSTWLDGQWHLTTATYELTTGASGTGSVSYYIDGVPQTLTVNQNTITSASVPGTIAGAYAGADGNADGTAKAASSIDGMLDDYAMWNNRLTDTEVKALYNLGIDPLDYNAQNAQALFDIFASGVSSTVGGVLWKKASGLAGMPGTLDSDGGLRYLVLDGSNGGVQQVPEPGTLTLLAAALGLAVVAGRRRK